MVNRAPFTLGEWYHCFNRGVEKRKVFEDEHDANRFLMLLYLANSTESVDLYNIRKPKLEKTLLEDRGDPIVSIGAYCLMPNHFHLLLKEIKDGGITSLMRRVGIAYAMYFNAKYERVGNLFLKPFRSRHIGTDRYFQKVIQYIHCNPVQIYEPDWKSGKVRNMSALEQKLTAYPYSSLQSYLHSGSRNPIISADIFEIVDQPRLSRMLEDARAYYQDIAGKGLER